MEALKLLLRQFEEGAKAFPGMTHVVMKWPKDSPKPEPPTGLPKHCQLAYDKDNLCEVHITPPDNYRSRSVIKDNPLETAEVDVDISHWTIRPRDKSWDRKTAIRRLKILSEDAGRIYEELKVPPIPSVQCVGKQIVPIYLSERWLLALHKLRTPNILTADIWKEFLSDSNRRRDFQEYSFLPLCSILRDVFLESALACSMLLGKVGGGEVKIETEQDTTPAKRCRIWTLVKRIPRWIYVLVIFLAAFLTCVYLLWWLWTKFSA